MHMPNQPGPTSQIPKLASNTHKKKLELLYLKFMMGKERIRI